LSSSETAGTASALASLRLFPETARERARALVKSTDWSYRSCTTTSGNSESARAQDLPRIIDSRSIVNSPRAEERRLRDRTACPRSTRQLCTQRQAPVRAMPGVGIRRGERGLERPFFGGTEVGTPGGIIRLR
jgi:hypothetical protein